VYNQFSPSVSISRMKIWVSKTFFQLYVYRETVGSMFGSQCYVLGDPHLSLALFASVRKWDTPTPQMVERIMWTIVGFCFILMQKTFQKTLATDFATLC
jgi:hypothetical protein